MRANHKNGKPPVDDRYTVSTPEHIDVSYAVAGIGSRFLAAILDTSILLILQGALFVIVFTLDSPLNTLDPSGTLSTIVTALWILLSFMIFWGYYLVFEMLWNGSSPGKRVIQLRVVREGGRPITFASSTIRNLVRVIDFLPSFYGIGVMTMFIDPRARRLGDLAGGTLVVKERNPVSLESLTRRTQPESLTRSLHLAAQLPPLPNLHLLTDDDYHVARQFLERRTELGKARRRSLGAQLAQNLAARLGITIGEENELFIERVAYGYRISRQDPPTPPLP